MTASPEQMSFLSEILEWEPIPEEKLVYFRERLRNRLHAAIIDAFIKRSKERGLKQSDLATRIHRTRAQITRWFSTTSNLTLDSISDLMVGLGMDFDAFPFTPIEKTIAIKEQQTRQATETAKIQDLNRKILENLRPWIAREVAKLIPNLLKKNDSTTRSGSAIRYWEEVALSSAQPERSPGKSAAALAPPPSSGTTASTIVEALRKYPCTNVIDFAARAQKRTEQLARKTTEQKDAFLNSGVAA
jgi:transcriptional regulator with XRE-family HTH domain